MKIMGAGLLRNLTEQEEWAILRSVCFRIHPSSLKQEIN